jgi:hypothetical protein
MVNDAKVQSELIPLLLATIKNDPLMLAMHDNVLKLAVSNADSLIANAIINHI